MIVRRIGDRLELITQPDHARLAARVMERSVALRDEPRRDSILRAIAGHDDGWRDEDAAPMVDAATGEVLDFIHVPVAVRQGVWPRAIARLDDDPWAAALVAHHAAFVYGRFRGDAEWAPFYARMERARDERVAASGLTRDALDADYRYLRLGDLVSLAFCTGSTDRHEFAGWTVELRGARVVVTPDPFGVSVRMAIDAHVLPVQRFESSAELHERLGAARIATLRGEVGDGRGSGGH